MTAITVLEGRGDILRLRMLSSRDGVEEALEAAREFIEPARSRKSPNLEVVLRELLINAAGHGNRWNPERRVSIALQRVGAREVRVEVEDEGEGFEHEVLAEGAAGESQRFGRCGYVLIHRLVDRLEFNERGNRVIVHVTLREDASGTDEQGDTHRGFMSR